MIKTVIIEDEPLVAKNLIKTVSEIDASIEVQAVLDSVKSSTDYFAKNSEPDLIFADIQLSDGVSFDLFKKIQLSCPIIFTTAYNEYAIRAFKVNGIDYLMKPIDKEELTGAIEKFKRIQSSGKMELNDQLQSLISHLALPQESKIYKERFAARSGKSHIIVNYTNIASFQKDALIYITTNDGQQFITDFQTMEEIEELLNPKFFFRANRQIILNVNAVESFKTDVYSKLIVKLKPPLKITVDISREKAQAFKNWVQ